MDYELQIKMTALNNASSQISAVTSSVNNLDNATKKVSKSTQSFGQKMVGMGSQLNVLGQRMTWMVSVPLLAFGNKAIETALDVEKSWVRFRKVFSGTEDDFVRIKKSVEDLSVKFGRPIEEINNVMAEFNKAGIESADELEKLGAIVSETAITFDIELEPALQGVKSVMMGFNLSADETRNALASLNIIADKTTASEQGILEVFNRAAGTARMAGFSFMELAASQAAFEKNAIPAGRAGNAMKSILVSLTKQSNLAKDQFRELGVDMSSASWRTADAGDKLEILSKKLLEVKNSGDKLKLAKLNEAMASLVGKFQINNLNVLLEDMSHQFDNNAESVSQFYEGISVASNETENLKWQLQQVNKVLESNPQKVASLNEKYRLQAAILGNQLLPIKIKLLETLSKLLDQFNNLSPTTQKVIVIIGALLVVLGPLLAFLGLIVTGAGMVATGFGALATGVGTVATAVGGGLVLALIAATVALGIIAAVIVSKAVTAFVNLETTLKENRAWLDNNSKSLDIFQTKVGSLSTAKANEQLQNAINKSREMDKALKDMTDRYDGLGGALRAVGDQFVTWGEKAWKAIDKVKKKLDKDSDGDVSFGEMWKAIFNGGGIVPAYNSGGLVYAANGFLARGRDTIPAMLSPGEMVLNKSQQSSLFDVLSGRTSMQTAGGPTINLNVGTMIASRGEQREFARRIKELISENNNRY